MIFYQSIIIFSYQHFCNYWLHLKQIFNRLFNKPRLHKIIKILSKLLEKHLEQVFIEYISYNCRII